MNTYLPRHISVRCGLSLLIGSERSLKSVCAALVLCAGMLFWSAMSMAGPTASFTISVTSAGHGTVSPASQTVAKGASVTFLATADTGYHVSSVLAVHGTSCAISRIDTDTWQVINVQADCSIEATFMPYFLFRSGFEPGVEGLCSLEGMSASSGVADVTSLSALPTPVVSGNQVHFQWYAQADVCRYDGSVLPGPVAGWQADGYACIGAADCNTTKSFSSVLTTPGHYEFTLTCHTCSP